MPGETWRHVMRALGFDPEPLGRMAYRLGVMGDTEDTAPFERVEYAEDGRAVREVIPWRLAMELE